LTQANLVHALEGIVATLGLDESDCGLLMMPQFHVHGLQAGLLAPLVAGGRVVLPSGFDALSAARLCVEHRVTWYTAVPTMHRLIVDRADRSDGSWIEPIRFVRSSSSAMPTTLAGLVEDLVEAPLIEAYGMTECAHQITSNQLPPQQRVIGTVGLPTGVEVRIDDERDDGRGEVLVRGPSVMSGYESAGPGVNAKAFSDGWLRTGDEGTMDGEGRLTLTGRLKEIINRGGEKVRPQEVEQVLSEHPDVVEVAVFAVPHPRLGEDVAAAVVTTGAEITPQDVRNHARGGLAAFKVPRQVLIVDQIPRGPTGKVQRSILAAQLGLS
jgi:acyl-CoA synthetase (AMP-forming)/AMP-acid ligase II